MSEGLVNKAQYHFERLNDIINHGKTPVPLSIELQITNTCHQACYYCNSEIFRKHNPDKATTEDWINFIDNLKKTIDRTSTDFIYIVDKRNKLLGIIDSKIVTRISTTI